MVHRFRRLIPLFILGLAVITGGLSSAHAEDGTSQAITLTPASYDVAVDPGATVSKELTIINGGDGTFNVALTTSPYHVDGGNYDPQFTQIPGTVDASEWVTLSKKSATIAGNKTITVPFDITIPKNTAPGGYYAVLFAETSTDDPKSGVVSHNKVGSILYISVNGDVKSAGTLSGTALPSFSFGGPISIGTKVSNSGGVHFITKTAYTVTDFGGNKVFSSTAERYVLPQTERVIAYDWTPKGLIGIYTVHRTATIAGELKTLPDQKIFMISPWLLVSIAFFIGLLVGFPLKRARRRRRSKEK